MRLMLNQLNYEVNLSGLSLDKIKEMQADTTLTTKTQGGVKVNPTKVEGRVAHIDGDFMAYIVAADRVGESETTMCDIVVHTADFVQQIMDYCGATDYMIHLTRGDKGGRADQALLKPYQANRANKESPRMLAKTRKYYEDELKTFVCTMGEADDSLAYALYNAKITGNKGMAVMVSQDKDLRMCEGLHMDWTTGELFEVDTFGRLYIETKVSKDGKKSKKIRGYGGIWFFAQLLMGDRADNICGLPAVTGDVLNSVAPTQAIEKAKAVLADPNAKESRKSKAEETLANRPPKSCGEVMTYELLKSCRNLRQALYVVRDLYFRYGEQVGFTDYNENPITWEQAFESECKLLYMRHTLQENDFKELIEWITDTPYGLLEAPIR